MAFIGRDIRQETPPISLRGGLNMSTSPVAMNPGNLIACKNYESVEKGYGRIDGFERFDGRPKPSEASYWVLNFDAGSAAITAGQTVTGATSGATGKALVDAVVSTGTYGGANAAGYLVLTVVSGTFQDNEALQVAAVTKSTANGAATERGALTDANNTTWYRLAVSTARALIQAVPGTGNILGVWPYAGAVYAFRNFTGGAEARMYKSTTAGWTQVALGYKVAFTISTTTPITVGQTIVGATSAAQAVVTGVAVRTGSFASGSGAGILTFAAYAAGGPFTNGENLQVGGVTRGVAVGASAAITLLPNGRYEFHNFNFGGSTSTYRMYGCDGVNLAFEFDGTTFIPIATGMTTDAPKHLRAHRNHLFLAFAKGSLQHSSIGNPYAYTLVTGSDEIGMGQEITGLIGPYSQNMIVICRSKVGVLYGSDVDTFELVPLMEEAGGVEWTHALGPYPICMDDRGLRNLTTTNRYGDYNIGTLTEFVTKALLLKKKQGVTPVAAVVVKKKNQYRLFFSDNSVMSLYFAREIVKGIPEITFQDYGKRVYAVASGELTETGDDITLFGSSDGYIYEADAGTSFDGEELEAYFRLAYCNDRRPLLNKAWKGAQLEVESDPTATVYTSAEFGYGDPDQPGQVEQQFDISGGGLIFDVGNWDINYFDAPEVGTAKVRLEGEGTNVSVSVYSNTAYEAPHVFSAIILFYTPRGRVRP